MDGIDWKAPARLYGGEGATLRQGTVGELAHHVAELSADKRAGLVLEVEGGETIEIDQILELAARGDLRE